MLQDPQVLGNDHNKPHSLMSDPISTMYFHNMFCDLLNKILFKPNMCFKINISFNFHRLDLKWAFISYIFSSGIGCFRKSRS